ncbi:MAG: AzlD domain-containing protein [Treponema sp.]|nr:AzlD domain-containing protein [Treponema sp.]
MKYTLIQILIISLAIGALIFLERAFPFLLFSKKEPPKFIRFIERFIPPLVMSVLVVYCLKDMTFYSSETGLTPAGFVPYIAASLVTTVLHLWKKNPLLSISGGTILYMILIRIL